MISIALATYNGERFIKEQLDSIFKQTMLPDEIIIYDDNSTDKTWDIVNQYIENNKSNIKIIAEKNQINQGFKKNFYNAIRKCSGDYIFLCDQDDIWNNNKIELMIKEMEKNNRILLMCSNYKSIYIENCKTKVHEKKYYSLKKTIKLNKYKNFVNTPRPGCTYCIRKELVKVYIENVDFTFFHDNLLWHLASINNGTYIFNKQTMLYRRHSTNASNNKLNTFNKRLDAIKEQIKSLDYILNVSKNYKINRFIFKQREVFIKRLQWLENKEFLNLIFLIRYRKYFNSLREWLVDIYYCMKG